MTEVIIDQLVEKFKNSIEAAKQEFYTSISFNGDLESFKKRLTSYQWSVNDIISSTAFSILAKMPVQKLVIVHWKNYPCSTKGYITGLEPANIWYNDASKFNWIPVINKCDKNGKKTAQRHHLAEPDFYVTEIKDIEEC